VRRGKRSGRARRLDSETGLAPVPALSIVPNGVTGSEADPLRNGAVLLLGFRKLLLGTERLVAGHGYSSWLSRCCAVLMVVGPPPNR